MKEYQYAAISEDEHQALFAYLRSENVDGNLSDYEKFGKSVFDSLSDSTIFACRRYANLLSIVLDYERQIAELKTELQNKRKELDSISHYDPTSQIYILRVDKQHDGK
jgi:hypothetical protein